MSALPEQPHKVLGRKPRHGMPKTARRNLKSLRDVPPRIYTHGDSMTVALYQRTATILSEEIIPDMRTWARTFNKTKILIDMAKAFRNNHRERAIYQNKLRNGELAQFTREERLAKKMISYAKTKIRSFNKKEENLALNALAMFDLMTRHEKLKFLKVAGNLKTIDDKPVFKLSDLKLMLRTVRRINARKNGLAVKAPANRPRHQAARARLPAPRRG